MTKLGGGGGIVIWGQISPPIFHSIPSPMFTYILNHQSIYGFSHDAEDFMVLEKIKLSICMIKQFFERYIFEKILIIGHITRQFKNI